MASTPVIYSTVYESDLESNATHRIENATALSDGIDRSSWFKEVKVNPLYKASLFIGYYHSYILCAIGVPCNILSFLVLRRTKPLTSAIVIMIMVAVIDTLSLITNCSDLVIQHIISKPRSTVGCSIFFTIRYFLVYMPVWLVVLLTLERVVAVCFPMKAAQVCTISNARRSVFILFILDVLMCIVHTFMYENRHLTHGAANCYVKVKFDALHKYWSVVDAVLFVIIPLILLCIGNTAIIVKLATSKQTNIATSCSSISEANKHQNRSITVMLLAVSLTTIICLSPNFTLSLFGGLNWATDTNVSASIYARQILASWIIMSLMSVNNAVNFFLYVLSGRRFRTEVYDMITNWSGKHKPIAHISTENRHP